MMFGKPYLTADGCWMETVAKKFDLGWSVPYGDIEAITVLVNRLIAQPGLLAEAGRRGRAAFEAHFQWYQQRENLEELYDYLLSAKTKVEVKNTELWGKFIGTSVEM